MWQKMYHCGCHFNLVLFWNKQLEAETETSLHPLLLMMKMIFPPEFGRCSFAFLDKQNVLSSLIPPGKSHHYNLPLLAAFSQTSLLNVFLWNQNTDDERSP